MRSLLVLAFVIPVTAQKSPLPASMAVELRITDEQGGPVQSARVQLLGVVADTKRLRALPEAPRELAPKDFTGDHAVLANLPAGEFVLRIDADLHALTLSEKFELPAQTPPKITVRMRRGATLTGLVTSPDGKPLAAAEVRTQGAERGRTMHPLVQMADLMWAETATAARVRTGNDGTFRIDHVAKGNYRVIAEHGDFAPGVCEVRVGAEGVVETPRLALVEGCLVTGQVTRRGEPAAGITVLLQSDNPWEQARRDRKSGGQGGGTMNFHDIAVYLTTRTDADGRYRMPSRVPVGLRYVIDATEVTPGQVGNPSRVDLLAVANRESIARSIDLAKGTDGKTVNLVLPAK